MNDSDGVGPPADVELARRTLARGVREMPVDAFRRQMEAEGITRAFVVFENGVFTLSHPRLLEPLQAFFELSQDFASHEGVFIGREDGLESLFFAFVHDTRRGLAQGGLRFWGYPNIASVLVDGLRLAQGMTRKNALAGLWWGGGKGIMTLPPSVQYPQEMAEPEERRRHFEAYGRFVASLGGVYYTAEDVGTTTADMEAVLSQNRFTTCIPPTFGGSGNPSPFTARGVLRATEAAWEFLTGARDLRGVRVAVQGAGNVGSSLIRDLDDTGAEVWISDLSRARLEKLKAERPRLHIVDDPDGVFDLDVDVFAPCAGGAVINAHTIPRLKARLICGAANNVLKEPDDAERLRDRGIHYVPDYLCNRMGIANCADEWMGHLTEDVRVAAERVFPDTLRVFKQARELVVTTTEAADHLADIAAAELNPMLAHRGRRIIDRIVDSDWRGGPDRDAGRTAPRVTPAFDHLLHEPPLRVRFSEDAPRDAAGPSVAAAPMSAAGPPSVDSILSAVLADVRARAIEAESGRAVRRVVGSDHGGFNLQLAVERELPYRREEVGRARFLEACNDTHGLNDAATREALHHAGVAFDPRDWLDPMAARGEVAVRRLYFALKDAGHVSTRTRFAYHSPSVGTVLVNKDVERRRTRMEWYEISLALTDGSGDVTYRTFRPEALWGAVAVAVDPDGPFAHLAGRAAENPFGGGPLPIVAAGDLDGPARLITPMHSEREWQIIRSHGLPEGRAVYDVRGRVLLPDGRTLDLESARAEALRGLEGRLERGVGTYRVPRCRRTDSLLVKFPSSQVFLDLQQAVPHLVRAIESGAVQFQHTRWRKRALELLENLPPWCISRQYWWGNPLPDHPEDTLSTWFSLAATSLAAAGWPESATPEPIDEVYADPNLFERWVLPSLLVSLTLTGRPCFRRVHVHQPLYLSTRSLEARDGTDPDAHDEERFLMRWVHREMRPEAGNVVQPNTLVRRFGADALRLGLLLCRPTRHTGVAALSEGRLRRARRTLRRLNGKVTGLCNLARDGRETAEARLLEGWALGRLDRLGRAARDAYARDRLPEAAGLFIKAVDVVARYANVAAERRLDEGGALGPLRATLAAAMRRLEAAFGPICPFILVHLGRWTAAQVPEHTPAPEALAWMDVLDEAIDPRAGVVEVVVADDDRRATLEADLEELGRLTRVQLHICAVPGGDAWVELDGDTVAVRTRPPENVA